MSSLSQETSQWVSPRRDSVYTYVVFDVFSVRGFELHCVPGAQQNRVYGFHGVSAHLIAQHVNSYDGKHVRARHRTERKGMDETGDETRVIWFY